VVRQRLRLVEAVFCGCGSQGEADFQASVLHGTLGPGRGIWVPGSRGVVEVTQVLLRYALDRILSDTLGLWKLCYWKNEGKMTG
jgi:hypothetical protein